MGANIVDGYGRLLSMTDNEKMKFGCPRKESRFGERSSSSSSSSSSSTRVRYSSTIVR